MGNSSAEWFLQVTGWIFRVTPPPAQAAQLKVQHTKPLSPSEPPPPPEPNLFVHTSSSQSPSNLSLFTIMPPDLKLPFLYFPVRTQFRETHNSRELATGSLHQTPH